MKPNMASREAFDRLVLPQLESLSRTALWFVGNVTESRALLEEAFVSAYRAWRDGWLCGDCRIGLFSILSLVLTSRDQSFSTEVAQTSDHDVIGQPAGWPRQVNRRPIDHSGRKLSLTVSGEDIRSAMQRVPGNLRLTVVLSLVERFSCREIADITGSHVKAVRARLHQGRRLLQRELFGHGVREGCTIQHIGTDKRSKLG